MFMKWHPGYMSAPHHYATDRLSVVLSGACWVNSGKDFRRRIAFQCRDDKLSADMNAGPVLRVRNSSAQHFVSQRRGIAFPKK